MSQGSNPVLEIYLLRAYKSLHSKNSGPSSITVNSVVKKLKILDPKRANQTYSSSEGVIAMPHALLKTLKPEVYDSLNIGKTVQSKTFSRKNAEVVIKHESQLSLIDPEDINKMTDIVAANSGEALLVGKYLFLMNHNYGGSVVKDLTDPSSNWTTAAHLYSTYYSKSTYSGFYRSCCANSKAMFFVATVPNKEFRAIGCIPIDLLIQSYENTKKFPVKFEPIFVEI